jgi:hypothetical protein
MYKMSSVQTAFSQPKTRTLVVTQNENVDNNGAYFFSQAAIDSWISDESSDLSTVGSVVTVTGNFYNIVNNLNSTGVFQERKSLLDLGKEYIIGNSAESRLIVLRRVRARGAAANAGDDAQLGYVCTENYTTDLAPNNWGRFTVRVARV